ncbi:MAG: hypothetical protein WKF55_00240 [Gemmatimonadaceae bacterium]
MSSRKKADAPVQPVGRVRETLQGASGFAAPLGDPRAARRKNLWISQTKLDAAKKHLGVRTETEAIDVALDLVAFQHEVLDGLASMGGCGGFVNYFEDDDDRT